MFAATTFPFTANFGNPNDFDGWNCGKITTCGKFKNICGGYNVKTGGDDIQQTFMLPAGETYFVTMDFIKIDSWFAWRGAWLYRMSLLSETIAGQGV